MPRRVRVRTFAKFGIPLLLLVGLTVGHSGYDSFRQSDAAYRKEIRGRLRMVAEVVADSVDPGALDRLQSPTDLDRPEYEDLVRRMRHAAAATEIGWIGIFRESRGHLYLLADMAETGIDYPFFYATPDHWEALREGLPRDVRYTDEFGAYVGHVVPVPGPDGRPVAIVEASVQQDLLDLFASQERARMLRSVALAAGIAMLLVLLLTILIVERPLRRLRHGVAMLSQGNFDHRLDIRGHDEFAQVADAFNGMAADLKKLYGGMEGLVQARTRNLETKNAELQEALQRLKGAQDLLLQREKMAAVGQLVSGVAHELNNPLAGIMGYAQICMDRTQDERQRGSLQKICAEAQRAGRIVRNLLTFSRKSAGEVTYVDVNEVIRRTLELRAYHLRTEGVAVDLQLHPDPLRTLA
ncbi:MAG: histidine kinase dimerization/phospho-acceptor domain-containing protein, partial [Acidobacteriota bacterium]